MNRKPGVFLAVALVVLASIPLTEIGTSAQDQPSTPRLIQAEVSPPLRNMKPVLPREGHRVLPLLATSHKPSSGQIDPVVQDRKSTRLNSSHIQKSRMPSSA